MILSWVVASNGLVHTATIWCCLRPPVKHYMIMLMKLWNPQLRQDRATGEKGPVLSLNSGPTLYRRVLAMRATDPGRDPAARSRPMPSGWYCVRCGGSRLSGVACCTKLYGHVVALNVCQYTLMTCVCTSDYYTGALWIMYSFDTCCCFMPLTQLLLI